MADFGFTSYVVKNNPFQQYCMVFYAFQNCALYNKDIERLCVTSRKAIRMLWRLPCLTHSALLPHITGIPPLDIGIAKRFLKHVHTIFNYHNSLVRFIFHISQCILIPEKKSILDIWHTNMDFILRI